MYIQRLIFTPFQIIRSNLLLFSTAIVLLYGWTLRDDNYLTAEDGAGYLLGILGGSLMLAILFYPLSKRVALLTRLIPIRYWFGFHMLLGTVGPAMILFHANFQLGSTNSTVALASMLLSAGSGILGRYLYTRIHHGLYGTRIKFKELKQNTENDHAEILKFYAKDEKLSSLMDKMEEMALRPYTGMAVTPSAVDLREDLLGVRSGIRSREEILQRNLAFLDRADVKGTLAIEREVMALLREIEGLKGRLRRLEADRMMALARIDLTFLEQTLPEDIPSSFGWINGVSFYGFVGGGF